MRIRTTNLENRSSPWTDLIALIKVHPALFSSKNCKQHNTCKPNPVSAFSSRLRLNFRVLQLQESRLCPFCHYYTLPTAQVDCFDELFDFAKFSWSRFSLSSFVSLPPALGERWDFVPVFPLSSLVYANSSLKATAYWPRLGLPGFEPHRPRPRWTLATLAAPRQLLPRRADFGLGGPFGRP